MKSTKFALLLACLFFFAACQTSVPTSNSATPPSPSETSVSNTPEAGQQEAMVFISKLDDSANPFNKPGSLAFDADGNLYILNGGNSRIQKFDSQGNFLLEWGTEGSGEGEFIFHREADILGGIDIDSAGNVYVADVGNFRIQVFDSQGDFLRTWGAQGSGDGQFEGPIDVAISPNDMVYAIDDRRNDIQVFDSGGIFQFSFAGNSLRDTGGLEIDKAGNVYVADFGDNEVQVFTGEGTPITSWGELGGGEGQFDGPCDVAFDSQGRVYVTSLGYDERRPDVQAFDANGDFLWKWGSYGTDPGQFRYSCGIAIDVADIVYVADFSNNNVQLFEQP